MNIVYSISQLRFPSASFRPGTSLEVGRLLSFIVYDEYGKHWQLGDASGVSIAILSGPSGASGMDILSSTRKIVKWDDCSTSKHDYFIGPIDMHMTVPTN